MIWTTWRQHRAEAMVGTAILATLAAGLLVVGSIARERARAAGVSGCGDASGRCGDALNRLHDEFHVMPPFISALIAIPFIAGMFWTAPLISREYEAGTHRLAWTQSVSPRHWITVKIAVIFSAVAAAALIVGLLANWTLDPLTAAFGGRYNSTWYDVQGVVPVACMLFALAVGVAASALIRRTIPAMAVTLVTYAAVRIPIHWIRWQFAPLSTRTVTVPLTALLDNPIGAPRDIATSTVPLDAWLRSIAITGPTGRSIDANSGNFDVLHGYCPDLQSTADRTGVLHAAACGSTVRNLSLHETIKYQPGSHFWLIQGVESAIFTGLAGLLIVLAIGCVTRRRPT